MEVRFAMFDTALGASALVWRDGAIVGSYLPEADRERTRAGVLRRHADAQERDPPADIAEVVAKVQALFRGEGADLSNAPLDLSFTPEFHRRVYEIALSIPPGRTMTYGEIAEQLGDLLLARAVGQALGKNPFAPIVPCHRVLAAGGKTGGFSARGGVRTKLKLLEIEGALAADTLPLFAR